MIPKIIHQTISNKSHLHEDLKENIQKLKDLNPNWEYRLYDDQDRRDVIDKSYGKEILELYDKINPNYGQARADFFRYLALHAFGGVYLDIKSTCSVPLDEVILDDDEYILSHWNNDIKGNRKDWGMHPELLDIAPEGEYQIWHIIAKAEHPFLNAVISKVVSNLKNYHPENYGVGRIGVLRTTGPIPYTIAISNIRKDHQHRVVDIEENGFKDSVFEDNSDPKHHEIYGKKHYSMLTEPIVLNGKFRIADSKIKKVHLNSDTNIELLCHRDIKSPVLVASHERSGTHFAMNSIALNSPYCANPHLNLDLEPFGGILNFTNPNAMHRFFCILSEKQCYNIIKSHFPIEFLLKHNGFILPKDFKIIYIYRNPVDTIISYKNFIDHFNKNNHEGPFCDNFLDFAISPPEGRIMRYQLYQTKSIIKRWENHVSGWLKAADRFSHILPMSYENLNGNYEGSISKILEFVGVTKGQEVIRPNNKDNVVNVSIDKKPSVQEREQLVKLIKDHLSDKRLEGLVF